ncbi:hypothetical protein [Chitinophaga sp. Cy-1792]|uniref:hypothetical protein n=1 Tax=Chitinophaga sp. Cy-1792 TaxID=2608339 RepID=UPI001421AB4E|nr:hypothetical protein [Chitinophaga sp. Cy-1792]NIG56495.1 hypothetical protein [Chitinophaga sp. Cy-1792]
MSAGKKIFFDFRDSANSPINAIDTSGFFAGCHFENLYDKKLVVLTDSTKLSKANQRIFQILIQKKKGRNYIIEVYS